MITLNTNKFNYPSLNNYNQIINKLNLFQIKCICGVRGQCKIHGYYSRSVKTPFGKICLRIMRVICSSCKKTHAILLDSIVPYSQITMKEHIHIILAFEEKNKIHSIMERSPEIDESNLAYILKKYKEKWRERIRCISDSIPALLKQISKLITLCFQEYHFNFMQVQRFQNILQPLTT